MNHPLARVRAAGTERELQEAVAGFPLPGGIRAEWLYPHERDEIQEFVEVLLAHPHRGPLLYGSLRERLPLWVELGGALQRAERGESWERREALARLLVLAPWLALGFLRERVCRQGRDAVLAELRWLLQRPEPEVREGALRMVGQLPLEESRGEKGRAGGPSRR